MVILLSLGIVAPEAMEVRAQLPSVEWLYERALEERPAGNVLTWDVATQTFGTTPVPMIPAQPQDPGVPAAESDIDWFNDVCLVRDASGVHIGYAVCGYSNIPNWNQNTDPCVDPRTARPAPLDMETLSFVHGQITGTVAYYDLQGQQQWYHTYMGGAFFGIIQDKNGDLVIAGSSNSRTTWPMAWSNQPLYYNPTVGQQTHDDMANAPCDNKQSKMVLLKVDVSDGHAIWNHMYGDASDPELALHARTVGYSVAEVDPDGDGGYKVVGYWKGAPDDPLLPGKDRPFLVDVDVNGMLNWKQVMNSTHVSGYWPDAYGGSQAFRIVRHPDPSEDKYLITGVRANNTISAAFLFYYDDNGSTPVWWEDSHDSATEYALSGTSNCTANRACFAVSGGTTSIIWPMLTDIVGAWWASYNHSAVGRVYRMDLNGDQLWAAPVDLGWMRGYDRLFSANQRANGNIVVGCTKSSQTTTPLTFGALSPAVQTCLQNNYSYDPDNNAATNPQAVNWHVAGLNQWGHWLSDSYMAELDLNTAGVVWEGTWDADVVLAHAPPSCAPDNIRQRQCSFQVIEADDGGLVGCGNTGHNVEDAYLIKFSGCESDPERYTAFHALHPYDPSNVYTLTANETWSTSMNVRGSVVVPAGKTLTINNGAVISFADSRRIGYTTNIVVQPGGGLLVTGGARLTNIGPCGNGMWDGIKALGNTANPNQNGTHQSTVQITGDAIVENAFVGILAANADINDPVGSTATDRGARVIGVNATFHNNIYDVVLRPYNSTTTPVTNFQECDFLTTAPLNYPDKTPKTHLYVNTYPRLNIRGCTFENTSPALDPANVAAWGKGIQGFETDLRINPLNGRDPHFTSLESGCFATNTNAKPVFVENAFFTSCGHGLGIVASGNARVTNCEFKEPDLDMVGQGLGAPVYGSYLDGTTTILFEHNAFWATITGQEPPYGNPLVGSTFKDVGANVNTFFNNTYSGFSGTNGAQYSAGVTIQGTNDGPNTGDGLHFRCNDLSWVLDDDFDIAFTGPDVSVGETQGSSVDIRSPAGNTFRLTGEECPGDVHMVVEDGSNQAFLDFDYWHHASTPGVQVIPTCITDPPLDPTPYIGINQPTPYLFNKEEACLNETMLLMSGGEGNLESDAAYAAEELVAAEVAAGTVAQNDGSETIQALQAAEVAYWRGRLSDAVMRYGTLALDSTSGVSIDQAIALHQQYPVTGSAEQVLLLRLAAGDLVGARADVDAVRAAAHDIWWDVQNIHLQVLEDSTAAGQVSAAQRSHLEAIAASDGQGAINARAWLAVLDGGTPTVDIILPHGDTKSFIGGRAASGDLEQSDLQLYPNPAHGDVRVAYALRTWGGNSRLELLDATGRSVLTRKLPQQAGELILPGMPLAQGVYTVVLMTDREVAALRKLIITH